MPGEVGGFAGCSLSQTGYEDLSVETDLWAQSDAGWALLCETGQSQSTLCEETINMTQSSNRLHKSC